MGVTPGWEQSNMKTLVACLMAGVMGVSATRAGPDTSERDAHGNTPLHLAAKQGDTDRVAALIAAGANVKAVAYNRYTPLHLAAWGGKAEPIKLLLAKGADPLALDYDCRTPLHYASTKAAVDALLAAGVAVDVRWTPWWRTPLLDAAMHGFAEAAEALLDHGADIQATNCSHFSPLHWAAWGGHRAVVKLLLERGADVHYVDDSGHPALFWAENGGHRDVAALLRARMASTPVITQARQ
jgi:ankyrin